jgi:hypothetical protein
MISILLVSQSAILKQAHSDSIIPRDKVVTFDTQQWYNNFRDAVVNPDTDKLYIVDALAINGSTGSIAVLNASNFEIIATIKEKYYPDGVFLNPLTGSLYVSHSCNCPEGKSLTIINGTTDRVMGTINNVAGKQVFINPVSNKIYATNSSSMSIIDGSTNKLLRTTTFGNYNSDSIWLATINPTLNAIYGFENKTLATLDLGTDNIIYSNITINTVPNEDAIDNIILDMVVNPNTNVIYLYNRPIFPAPAPNEGASIPVGYLAAINATSGAIISDNLAEMRAFYFDIVVNSDRNVVYATTGGNSFIAIDGSSNEIIDQYNFSIDPLSGFSPRSIVSNSATNSLYFIDPTAIIIVSESSVVPEFGAAGATIITAVVMIGALLIVRSRWHIKRN